MDLELLRYPIGKDKGKPFSEENKLNAIQTIKSFPARIRLECSTLDEGQLNSQYRPDGWTIGQVVHHCADSHINAYVRFKLALTEINPTIKPYIESEWAKLPDYKDDIDLSLTLIEVIHKKWVSVLNKMSNEDFERTYFHPEANKKSKLSENLIHYEWHCKHHLAHITEKKKRAQWN